MSKKDVLLMTPTKHKSPSSSKHHKLKKISFESEYSPKDQSLLESTISKVLRLIK